MEDVEGQADEDQDPQHGHIDPERLLPKVLIELLDGAFRCVSHGLHCTVEGAPGGHGSGSGQAVRRVHPTAQIPAVMRKAQT